MLFLLWACSLDEKAVITAPQNRYWTLPSYGHGHVRRGHGTWVDPKNRQVVGAGVMGSKEQGCALNGIELRGCWRDFRDSLVLDCAGIPLLPLNILRSPNQVSCNCLGSACR